MSEQNLETYRHVQAVFHNPYVHCELYEKDDYQYRGFHIQDEEIIRALAALTMDSRLDYSFHQEEYVLLIPWSMTISLQEYQASKHTWKETILLGKKLLFVMEEWQLPAQLYQICMDSYAIGIDEQQEIQLFQNPNFSYLKHHTLELSVYQRCASLLAELLASTKEVRHLRHHKLPSAYQAFQKKVQQKGYQGNVELMLDLIAMEHCFEKTPRNYQRLLHILMVVVIVLIVLLLLGIAIYYYLEWSNRTYEGIDAIGGRRLSS